MGNSDSIVEKKNYGFRIYKLLENGPLSNAGLKELEDFIIPPPEFSHNEYELREYLNQSLEKEIDLKIYNLTKRDFYYVKVTPSLNWKNSDKGCLGAQICFENFLNAQFNLLRVIKVISGSLSEKIGLIPNEDYIVGVKPKNDRIFTLNSSEGTDPIVLFTNVLRSNMKKDIDLYVYNSIKGAKNIKVNVTLKNNEVFGCDIIYGDGHEFPSNKDKTTEFPSEMDLSKSIAYSKNLIYNKSNDSINNNNSYDFYSNRYAESKQISSKYENSYASSINLSRSGVNSNEKINNKTISPLSMSKLSNNENENEKGSVSPLSLSKLSSNENESENLVIINYKDYDKNI